VSLLSASDADLLEAASLCRELAQRLRDAVQRQVETEAVRDVLSAQADRHDRVGDELEQLIRQRDLLPRVADPEAAGVHSLADQVAGLLDATGMHALLERFAAEQQRLSELLASAADDSASAQALRDASQAVASQARELRALIDR
jgi:hypothetical protein